MEKINYIFLNYKTYNAFKNDLDGGRIKKGSIVFIQDSHCIWAHDHLYQCGEFGIEYALQKDVISLLSEKANDSDVKSLSDRVDTIDTWRLDWDTVRDQIVLDNQLASVAKTGRYSDLLNTPDIPIVEEELSSVSANAVQNKTITKAISEKVDTSTLEFYPTKTELTNELRLKQNSLTAGSGIEIKNDVISSTLDTEVYVIVQTLPSVEEASPNKIYLLEQNNGDGTYRYIQCRLRNGQWVSFDAVAPDIDLQEYLKKSDAQDLYQPKGDYLQPLDLDPYFTKDSAAILQEKFNDYMPFSVANQSFATKEEHSRLAEYVDSTFVKKSEVYTPKQWEPSSSDETGSSGTPSVNTIIVDSILSLTSSNPVENRIITNALQGKVNNSDLLKYAKLQDVDNKISNINAVNAAALNDYVKTSVLNDALNEKQDILVPGDGIKIVDNVISTDLNIDTNVYIMVDELPIGGGNPDKIYILETEQDGEIIYTQWRWKDDDWAEIGQIIPQVDLSSYAKTDQVNQLLTGYQPKGTYLTPSQADATYQPVGSYATKEELQTAIRNSEGTYEEIQNTYATKDFLEAIRQNIESVFQKKGKYVEEDEIEEKLLELQQVIDQKYVLKKDVYHPEGGDWSYTDPTTIDVDPSEGGSSGGSSRMVTLTTTQYQALIDNGAVENDVYYFTYEGEEETTNWTFGGTFPVTLGGRGIGEFPITLQ